MIKPFGVIARDEDDDDEDEGYLMLGRGAMLSGDWRDVAFAVGFGMSALGVVYVFFLCWLGVLRVGTYIAFWNDLNLLNI